MDRWLRLRSVSRCPLPRFVAWLAPWAAVLALGAVAIWLCLARGLSQTNMDNRFAFGLWIFLDLAVIALGAGAFFTGLLVYIFRVRRLKAVVNSGVVLGFICYSGAILILMVDVGQPLRAWFTFWHPNVHSMLTEVTFCITCYLGVLAIEYTPLVLRQRQLREVPALVALEGRIHRAVPLLAAIGACLSFFHQGSLGGLYGVLQGRPFSFREGIGIWPSTFFLFVLSAIAVGPSFVLLTTALVERVTGRRLVGREVTPLLARISGWLLVVYVLAKSLDTLVWINRTALRVGYAPYMFYAHQPFGPWLLLGEIGLLGLVPALLLLRAAHRRSTRQAVVGAALASAGIVLNRYVLTIQTLALPTLSFDPFLLYSPSWQEVAAFLAVVAYGVILYSCSYRYLPLFPQEVDLPQR